jgi:hypothetical protein
MAGIKRLQAVPVVFVWIAFCFPGAASGMDATGVQVRDGAFAVVLAAPSSPPAQLVRAKADKPLVFSSASLAPPPAAHPVVLTELAGAFDAWTAQPGLRLTCPPLAPRPPPAA